VKRLLRGVMLIVIVAVIVVAAGAAAIFFVLPTFNAGQPSSAAGAEGAPAGEGEHAREAHGEPGMMYPLKERVLNLSDTGRAHYLKIELVLEFDLPEAARLKGEAYKKRQDEFIKEMASRRPIMDDIVTTVLTGKTSTVLATADGKEQLRDELKAKLGAVAGEHSLLNVYFTQFIVQ
jgi:flagellar FliL protein